MINLNPSHSLPYQLALTECTFLFFYGPWNDHAFLKASNLINFEALVIQIIFTFRMDKVIRRPLRAPLYVIVMHLGKPVDQIVLLHMGTAWSTPIQS